MLSSLVLDLFLLDKVLSSFLGYKSIYNKYLGTVPYQQKIFSCSSPDWEVCFLRTEDIFPIKFARLENRPRIFSPYEMVYFSNIFFKFCALDWTLHEWQFACARKIFSAHYILPSLGSSWGSCLVVTPHLSFSGAVSFPF